MNAGRWRLLLTGNRRGADNMAIDAAILKSIEDRRSPPTLRLYGWEPYCVSLGHFQNPVQELDALALKERGWDFVLRPTGGRAVLHAEEITYSLIARRDELPWCNTLRDSHDFIARAWAEAFHDFGLHVAVVAAGATHSSTTLRDRASPLRPNSSRQPGLPCFASTSRSELTFGERKVVGSAQRRTREAFLQHGSIPLTPMHEKLVEALRLTKEQRRSYLEALKRHAISLAEIRDLSGSMENETPRLAARLLQALEVQAETGSLTDDEIMMAGELEKMHSDRQKIFFMAAEGGATPS